MGADPARRRVLEGGNMMLSCVWFVWMTASYLRVNRLGTVVSLRSIVAQANSYPIGGGTVVCHKNLAQA